MSNCVPPLAAAGEQALDVRLQLADLARRRSVHGVVTPSQPAGVGSVARPTFAPANWSFSSALITNSVFAGVMPSLWPAGRRTS